MFNLSDTELDRLSRQAAEAYEVENNSSSWDSLAAKLDKELGIDPGSPGIHSPRGFRFFRSPFAYGSLIILVAASSYFLSKSFKQNDKTNVKSGQVVLQNQQGDLDKPTDQNNTAIATENNKTTNPQREQQTNDKGLSKTVDESLIDKNAISSKNTNDKKADEKNISRSTSLTEHRAADAQKQELANAKKLGSNATVDNAQGTDKAIRENEIAGNKNGLVEENIVDKTLSHQNQLKNKNTRGIHNKNHTAQGLAASNSLALDKTGNTDNKPDNNPIVDNDVSNVDNGKATHAASPGLSTEENLSYAPAQQVSDISNRWRITISDSLLLAEASKLEAQNAILPGKKNNHSLHIKQPLQIGLVVAPDFSKVRYTYDNSRLGGSIGLTLDFQLLHRLSLNTGLIYAHKYYQADDEDIHFQPSMVPAYVRVDFMTASCKLMEIPLNLRYDLSVEGNNRFFVSAGLSSYLMQNQSYIYYYHNPIGYQGWRQISYNTAENFWFSMLSLSAGFESAITKNFSIQVEPYVKVPLKEVGIGNVSLSSYGINLGFKYAPVLKRSRK